MVVRGFILDEVFSVELPATNGNIPYCWLKAGRWRDTNTNPPEPFWRTLVADRGLSRQNPPTFYPRACKESMRYKAKTMSKTGGYVDCRKLIFEGRCTIVAQFLRRVEEVVWNKRLITTKERRLGLVGMDVGPNFKVCILHGCSVPVILEEVRKSPRELAAGKKDRYRQWRKEFKRVVSLCQSKYKLRALRREKVKERTIEVQVPTGLGESLQWLGRQRKPSWPLRPTELLTCSMLAPLGSEIMVKSPDIRPDDALVIDGVVLSGQKMPSNAHLSAEPTVRRVLHSRNDERRGNQVPEREEYSGASV